MRMPTLRKRFPLSMLGKVAFWLLITCACCTGLFVTLIGFPDGFGLTIVTGLLLCSAGLVLIGVRWTPAISTLICGVIVFVMFRVVAFPWYHLTHPQPDYLPFLLDALIFVLLVMAGVTSLVTVIQNYLSPTRATPDWLKLVLSGMLGVVLGALLLAAILPSPTPSTASTNGEATVHLEPGTFLQPTVTITKGSKLLLIDDGAFTHVLTNGVWANGAVTPANEPGAPPVINRSITDGQMEIGPFTTAGTFHLACTLHQGMTLTILVK